MQIVHRIQPSTARVYALSIAAGLVLAAPLTAEAQVPTPEYEIEDFGFVSDSQAKAINALGQVTGSTVFGRERHAFLWLPQPDHGLPRGTTDLGTLGGKHGILGGEYSFANAVNDKGQVVGLSLKSRTALGIFVWLPEPDLGFQVEGMNEISPGPDVDPQEVFKIQNTHGWVIGQAATMRAYLWDHLSGFQDLGTLGGVGSIAWSINEAGQLVGSADADIDGGNVRHAFLITPGGALENPVWNDDNNDGVNALMIDLGTLGGATSTSRDINKTGQIVGAADTADETHAFLWDDTRTPPMMDLGTLGGTFSRASAINKSGQIVGRSTLEGVDLDGLNTNAFIWDSESGMRDLNDLLVDAPGWVLRSVSDINDCGEIVGRGFLNGERRAFLLRPIDPVVGRCDFDGDGVVNWLDNCPNGDNTVDSDDDGVPDCFDVCPGGDDAVDEDGNGIPDACDPDGGGNGGCTKGQKGDTCGADGDCCGNKCKGGKCR